MDRFRLLRLPSVALQEVLKPMTPFELINMSMTNIKTKGIVKSLLKTRNYSENYCLELVFCSNPEVSIEGSKHVYAYKFTSDESEYGGLSKEKDGDEIIVKFSEDVIKSFKKQAEYIFGVFNCDIKNVSFDVNVFSDQENQRKCTVEWLKSLQNSFYAFEIVGKKSDNSMVCWILENLKITGYLHLDVKIDEHLMKPSRLPILSYLHIDFGEWMDFGQFLQLNSSVIIIRNTKWTSNDYNHFLLSWIRMESHMNLCCLEVRIKNINTDEIFKNVEFEIIDRDVTRTVGEWKFGGGTDIRRSDGTVATLYVIRRMGKLQLKMVVHQ